MIHNNEVALVKQNVNLLEFPIWTISARDKRTTFEIETRHGKYTFKANKEIGIPDSIDINILYFLLYLSQVENKNEIITTSYSICKNTNISLNSVMYDRVESSLEKWSGVSLRFDNNYCNSSGSHDTVFFHVFSAFISTLQKKRRHHIREIRVKFDDYFMESIKETGMFDLIDLNLFIKLKNPISKRLYEYLPKHFADNKKEYNISDNLLFDKLRLKKQRYKSDIVRQFKSIETALNIYNESQNNHKFGFDYEQKRNSKTDFLCTFYKIEPENNIVYANKKSRITHKDEINSNKQQQQEVPLILDAELQNKLFHYGLTDYQINEFFNNPNIGIDGIKEGYEYFLKQLNDDKIHKNKTSYLSNAISKGWGKKTPEEIEKEKKQVAIEAAKKRIKDNKNILKLLKEDVSKCFEYKIKQFIDTIENIEELEKECRAKLNSFERQMYNTSKKAKDMFINKYIKENHIKETDEEVKKEIVEDKNIDLRKIEKEIKEAEKVLSGYGVPYKNIE